MNNRTLKTTLILSIVLNLSLAAGISIYALSYTGSENCKVGGGRYVFEKLNLTKDKQDKITAMADEFHHQLDTLGAQTVHAGKTLVKEIAKADSPTEKTDTMIEEISNRQKEIQMLIVKHLFEIKSELNNEQSEQFFKLLEDELEAKRGIY
jgi:Spy/CpxP family protein refolding chaperone